MTAMKESVVVVDYGAMSKFAVQGSGPSIVSSGSKRKTVVILGVM